MENQCGGGPPSYFDKYLDARFQSIEENVSEIKRGTLDTKEDIGTLRSEVHAEGKSLRLWLIGTLIALFLGMGGIVLGITQLQHMWFQQYLSQQDKYIQEQMATHEATKHAPIVAAPSAADNK